MNLTLKKVHWPQKLQMKILGVIFVIPKLRLNFNSLIVNDYSLIDAEYYISPGEGIKYGSTVDPDTNNNFHKSVYNSIYKDSRTCLPCHNMIIRDVLST